MKVFLLILVFISCSHQTLRVPSSQSRCFETLKSVTNNHLEEKEKRLNEMIGIFFKRMQEFEEDKFLSESRLVENMAEIFDELGVKVELISGKNGFSGLEIIDLDKSDKTFFRQINRHLKRTNTRFQIIPSLVKEYSAFGMFTEPSNVILLHYKSMMKMIFYNFVDGVFKHEMMHAYFTKNRKINPKSIFNIEYIETGIKPPYDYLSMEELYTFANQVYWSLDLVRDGRFLDRKFIEIDMDFKFLESAILNAKKITSGIREISKGSMKKFQDLKSGNARDLFAMIQKGKIIINFNDLKMIRVKLPSEKLPSDVTNKIPDEMIERFLKQDETVIELSNKLLKELNKLEKSLKNLKDLYDAYGTGVVSKKYMEKQLVLFRGEARKAGEIVRGDY